MVILNPQLSDCRVRADLEQAQSLLLQFARRRQQPPFLRLPLSHPSPSSADLVSMCGLDLLTASLVLLKQIESGYPSMSRLNFWMKCLFRKLEM